MYLTVAAYTDPILAQLVRGRLEAEGVVAVVADEHTALAWWNLRQALGGVKVRVAAVQFDEARRIVRSLDAGDFALEDEEPARAPLDRETFSSRLAYALLFLFSLPVPWSRASAHDR